MHHLFFDDADPFPTRKLFNKCGLFGQIFFLADQPCHYNALLSIFNPRNMEKWLDSTTVAIWIIIALLLIILLVTSLIKLVYINFKKTISNQQKESELKLEYKNSLIKTSIIAQEQERNRIAADLHDSIIGKLTVLRLKNQINYDFLEIDSLIEESIKETRRISHDLSPPMVEMKEMNEFIEDIIFHWKEKLNIQFYKNMDSNTTVENDLKIQITRIVQELIINIYKHAGSSATIVSLKISETRMTLIIKDNGKGFDMDGKTKGIGLKNIELRVNSFDGHYKIKSNGNGTTSIFVFELPQKTKYE